ncbi:MAG TPA: hypothetical protein VM935_07645 [Chitinophagaceae bacterium]|nr:hypothetical protein [Chitinophagaceae bacterium]
MSKTSFPNLLLLSTFFVVTFFTGCKKSNTEESNLRTITMYSPVYKSLSEVRAGMKSAPAEPLEATGKIYLFGKYIFLNEANKGIHIIDNSNPRKPKNMSFVNIPGNTDIAAQGDYLYADSYGDMVVLNISNPENIRVAHIVEKAFLDRSWYYRNNNSSNPDSIMIVAGYTKKDTLVEVGSYGWTADFLARDNAGSLSLASASVAKGTGGSMARFTIVNDYLYTVSSTSLSSFSISNPGEPKLKHINQMGWGIETIYPFKDRLFIGSNAGMYIYDIATPATPAKLGQISHVRSCDPVIADDDHAFVTLRSGSECAGYTNQLEVLDVKNLMQPVRLKIYPMANPHGLSKDGNLLFICDGRAGLKIYNSSNIMNLKKIKEIEGPDTYDVIAQNDLAIVVARDGLYQYDYRIPANTHLISKLLITEPN